MSGDHIVGRSSGSDASGGLGDVLEGRRVAVVGIGYWGRNYVRSLSLLLGPEAVVACDSESSRITGIVDEHPGVGVADGIEAVARDPRVVAAVVATPAATHFTVSRYLLEHGKHLLIEKPMTTDSREAGILIDIADRLGLTLMVGHTFLYHPAVQALAQEILNGEVGNPYYMYSRRTNYGPIRDDVNAVWDLAPHDVSIFNFLVGAKPNWVSASSHHLRQDVRADAAFVTLGYPSGILANAHVSWAEPEKTRQVVIVGPYQKVVFDDLATDKVKVVPSADAGVIAAEANGGRTSTARPVAATQPLVLQCEDFLASVATGSQPLSDGRVGLAVVEVMEAILASTRLHGSPTSVGMHAAEPEVVLDLRSAIDLNGITASA